MALNISFELQDQDLEYFRTIMQKTQQSVSQLSQVEILAAARALAGEVKHQVPDFVASRLKQLELLIR